MTIDPNERLAALREKIHDLIGAEPKFSGMDWSVNAEEALCLAREMDEYLTKGGGYPDEWQQHDIRDGNWRLRAFAEGAQGEGVALRPIPREELKVPIINPAPELACQYNLAHLLEEVPAVATVKLRNSRGIVFPVRVCEECVNAHERIDREAMPEAATGGLEPRSLDGERIAAYVRQMQSGEGGAPDATPVTPWMDESDFGNLVTNSSKWKGEGWGSQAARFEAKSGAVLGGEARLWEYLYCYWVDDSWASVILARAFLDARGEDREIFWDQGMEQYVILTNYAAPEQRKKAPKGADE